MNNNPVIYNDPMGDVGIRIERESKEVARRELRQFRREIRMLMRNSETFRNMVSDMKKDGGVTFMARNHAEGGKATVENGRHMISVGIHSDDSKGGGSRNLYATKVGTIVHEIGHAWMQSHNLEGAAPENIPASILKTFDVFAIHKHNQEAEKYRNYNERGGSDIGNVVVSEAIKSGSSGLKLQDYYYGGFQARLEINGNKAIPILDQNLKLNTLSPPHDEHYYMNNKIDIYEQYGVNKR
jgi:hypothetical protein